jgi:two-component system NtrC family sensor kinase
MNSGAEFLVLGGARTGESFVLRDRVTLGSDPTCDVRLTGAGVAPFHAVAVRAKEGGYRLALVEGASDLVVNGIARREAHVYHGQRVTVGGVEVQLLSAVERNPMETSFDLGAIEPRIADASGEIERVWTSDRYRTDGLDRESLDRLDAQDRALRGLYLVGQATTAERSLMRTLERSTEGISFAVKPDRLVIILAEGDELVPAVIRRGARDEKGARVPVSQAIVRKSVVGGLSVLTRGKRRSETAERPILCVPLETRNGRRGAIYVERLPGAPSFRDTELDFLAAVGRILGVAVERAQLEADARSRLAERDRERSRWHAVVQGLHSGVLILDGDGSVELANPAARKILSEQLGVADPATLRALGDVPLSRLVAQLPGDDKTLEIVVPGSPDTVLEVRPSPVIDPDGTRSGAALLLNDKTAERLQEAKLVQAEKLSMLGTLLAGIAHEINNPLATILGYAELLSVRASPADRQGLEAILEEAERCRRIVASLLLFARPQKAGRTLQDVGAIVGSVLDLLGHQVHESGVLVTRSLPELPLVLADRYELQQVFFNLVKNALDAIRGTQTIGKLALVAAAKPGEPWVRVEVRDSGPGFPAAVLGVLSPRPFFTTKGETGTGLGLSIANGIVRDHGGTITAGVAPEGGALVAVELPIAGATPAPAAPAVPASDDAPAKGKRVLIVDDESHVRALLGQICSSLGHVVLSASNGREALAILATESNVSAVLSDIRMPAMDGMAFWRELRARSHPLASRFAFISGDLARAETAAFLEEAGRPVLAKPFRVAQVSRILEDLLAIT